MSDLPTHNQPPLSEKYLNHLPEQNLPLRDFTQQQQPFQNNEFSNRINMPQPHMLSAERDNMHQATPYNQNQVIVNP